MPSKRTPFGAKVAELRVEKDMLLSEFADALGVSAAFVSMVEMGRKPVPSEWLRRIPEILEINADDLESLQGLAGRAKKRYVFEAKNDQQQRFFGSLEANLSSLSPERVNELLALIEGTVKRAG